MAYTKENIINELTGEGNIFATKKAARAGIEAIIGKIRTEVVAGNQVNIAGLCSFKPAVQAEKTGKIPGTDKDYTTPQKNVVRISASAGFKSLVAGE